MFEPRERPRLFASFFQGGFECSCHYRRDGRRLDIMAATRHDVLAEEDYRLAASLGLRTIRDGLRWHLIGRDPASHDWSSFKPMLHAARAAGVEVIWDYLHYGWPDYIDIWSPDFISRFADFSHAATELIRRESDGTLFVTPINEISFLAWAGGDMAIMNPFGKGRGAELKNILVKAAIAASEAIWAVDPAARILHIDPLINPMPNPHVPDSIHVAHERFHGQFEAWDMLRGVRNPELGGDPKYLDVIGINFYPHNQWIENWGPVHWTSGMYLPFRHLLLECYRRYGRPMFVAETGIEADLRPVWFREVCQEVAMARASGIPVEGICLYPVMNHPGWEDERHCPNGIIDYSRDDFRRYVDEPLAEELARQQKLFATPSPDLAERAVRPLEKDQTC